MSNKINVILVDDHEMVRLGLKSFLNLQGDVEVVGEAGNGREGVDLALELRPDVVVMDLVMPELDGVQATLELLKEWPEAKILVLTSIWTMKKFTQSLKLVLKAICLKPAVRQRFSIVSVRFTVVKKLSKLRWTIRLNTMIVIQTYTMT
ncbi:MAG: response regulator transcription factor [Streptococcus salivarius]